MKAKMRLAAKARERTGQATVELVVVLPVALILAVIVVNALMFFGTCASFDRVTRQAVCAYAAAPNADQGLNDAVAHVSREVEDAVGAPHVSVSVRASRAGLGLTRFTAQLRYVPTLFGLGMRSQIGDIALPELKHDVDLVVDMYRPGVLV